MPSQNDTPNKKIEELLEKNLIVNLYLSGANRTQIKAVIGVGTNKVDQIISKIKDLRRDTNNG